MIARFAAIRLLFGLLLALALTVAWPVGLAVASAGPEAIARTDRPATPDMAAASCQHDSTGADAHDAATIGCVPVCAGCVPAILAAPAPAMRHSPCDRTVAVLVVPAAGGGIRPPLRPPRAAA